MTAKIKRNDCFGNSVIKGLTTILLGEGNNDVLLIGKATSAPDRGMADNTRVRFLRDHAADGSIDNCNLFEAGNDIHRLSFITRFALAMLVRVNAGLLRGTAPAINSSSP